MVEYNKVFFVILTTVAILGLSGLNYLIMDNTDEPNSLKWLVPTDTSVFQYAKLGLFPWIITIGIMILIQSRNKFGPLSFMANYSSAVYGLFTYLLLILLSNYIWRITLDKEVGDKNDKVFYIITFGLSVFSGVMIWFASSRLIMSNRLDAVITINSLVLLVVWFTACSYNSCPNIYLPE
jgi:hypothetical protein